MGSSQETYEYVEFFEHNYNKKLFQEGGVTGISFLR